MANRAPGAVAAAATAGDDDEDDVVVCLQVGAAVELNSVFTYVPTVAEITPLMPPVKNAPQKEDHPSAVKRGSLAMVRPVRVMVVASCSSPFL